jgi:hypothetical protein
VRRILARGNRMDRQARVEAQQRVQIARARRIDGDRHLAVAPHAEYVVGHGAPAEQVALGIAPRLRQHAAVQGIRAVLEDLFDGDAIGARGRHLREAEELLLTAVVEAVLVLDGRDEVRARERGVGVLEAIADLDA